LISKVVKGFQLHPFFYILNNNASEDPILPYAHQAELLLRLALRKPVRILIGDEIGLGKTIEAILTARFIEERYKAKRVLLLVPRILLEQWRKELKRFGIQARVIERKNIETLSKEGFPQGWYIASIDLVKKDEYAPRITSVDWDIVIVDEAHRVGFTGSSRANATQRYRLVEELAKVTSRNIILLSATPHRGHATDYISRLRLVDPYLTGERELDDEEFYRLTRGSIVVRRTKIDVNEVYEKREVFKKARFVARVISATPSEGEFYRLLFSFLRAKLLQYHEYIGEEPRSLPLLLALIAKRASSSPYAAMKTLEKMLQTRSLVVEGKAPTLSEARKMLDRDAESIVEAYLGLGFEDYSDADDEAGEPDEPINRFVEKCSGLLDEEDIEKVEELFKHAKEIIEHGDSRLAKVLELVKEHINRGDKVVVFTEYKDTAEYIYSKLKSEMPELAGETALITSDKIDVPSLSRREGITIEEVKRLLKQGRIKLIISTDVASEGLNLQSANIVINYEPTWSPIKIEQRLGRVWRLGQEKEVTSYTLFLGVESDKDVLDILYRKLLAWGKSLHESRQAIGEEIVIDMATEEGTTTIPIDARKGTPRYSEYTAILKYISSGRSGLESYIESIVASLRSLKESLERVGLARKNIMLEVERQLLETALGNFRGENAEKALAGLFRLVAKLNGLNIVEREGRIFAGKFMASNIYDFYKNATSPLLLPDPPSDSPVYIASSRQVDELKELHLFKVTVLMDNTPVYSETLGVGVKHKGDEEIIRGVRLLELITSSLEPDYIVSSIQAYSVFGNLIDSSKEKAWRRVLEDVAKRAVDELIKYIQKLEGYGFSSPHKDWKPRGFEVFSREVKYLSTIIFTTPSESTGGAVASPARIKELEDTAMRIAMEYERKEGRVPEDVSMREHYDILSRDPRTGEIRFIEVKGKAGLDLEIELTEAEFNTAREKRDKYWLYIVYGIDTKMPRLLAIQNPVENTVWSEVSVKRYRLKPR